MDVYTARGRFHYTYTFEGELKSASEYSDPFDDVPNGRSMMVPTSLWLWAFSSPFSCMGMVVLGSLLLRVKKWAKSVSTEGKA
jgi:hypothetical protein